MPVRGRPSTPGAPSCAARSISRPTISRSTSSPSSPAPPTRRCTGGASSCCRTRSDAAALYLATGEEAARYGLLPYEISNYARPGGESRHNLAYWRYGDYAGIGPGAHGRVTLGGALLATRRHRAPEPWAARVERDGPRHHRGAPVDPADRGREALLMGLRLAEGVDESRFARRTGLALHDALDPDILAQAPRGGLSRPPRRAGWWRPRKGACDLTRCSPPCCAERSAELGAPKKPFR